MLLCLTVFILNATPFYAAAENRVLPQNPVQMQLSFSPLVKKVAPSVVNIYTKRTISTGYRHPFLDDPFFSEFFKWDLYGGRMRERVESALGSGVIMMESGLVVTNAHVIKGADEITVVLADGREFEAELSLSDEASDLALLRMKGDLTDIPFVELAPSENLEVGDLVLAIGNPFGVGQTVTSGIVSAQGRSNLDINDYNFFIQTDAAINPGNSGGPLVDMNGKVVGINTAIYSRSGGSMGIGFAIPAEMVMSIIAAEQSGQSGDRGIQRPWLGVSMQDVTSDIAASLGLDRPSGALISSLHSASPLKEAGAKVGDLVTHVNGHQIRDAAEMKFRMATVPIAKPVRYAEMAIMRGEETLTLKVKAMAAPDVPPRHETALEGRHALDGAVIANVNPAVAFELDLSIEDGVVVFDVSRGSRAASLVRAGDLILQINGQDIETVGDVQKALADVDPRKGISLVLNRGGRTTQIYVR
ncbi:MAG: Do family serine endopeptidase [Alphaproteobacteria bacterium]|nr:Do family serine endopeptidase [Alphaproteobacteria bacterium]